MSTAYARRNRVAIGARRVAHGLFRGARILSRRLKGRSPNEAFEAVWFVCSREPPQGDVERVRNRIGWYFGGDPGGSAASVPIGIVVPPSAWHARGPLPEAEFDYRTHADLAEVRAPESFVPARRDAILLWDAASVVRPRRVVRIDRTFSIDPHFYGTMELAAYEFVLPRAVDPAVRRKLAGISRTNLARLRDRTRDATRAYAVGTGPSAAALLERGFTNADAVVVCNSIVRNTRYLDHLRPVAICFADPVFHWGPSAYAAAFRADLLAALERTDAFAVTHEAAAYPLLRHYPSLVERIIVATPASTAWTPQRDLQLHLGPLGNVLTSLMIPVASLIADEVRIAGCDGRAPRERYFWRHDPAVQYEDLMKSAFETHPAFFRDRIYTDYYRQHCKALDRQLRRGERAGKRYLSVAKSYIPALRKRTSPSA